MKAKHGWTDTSVDDILEYVKDLLPAGNTCPGSLAEAKRITCPLDLPHEKYHACINDCIMYRKEHVDKTKCPVCDAERYKKGKKKAPRKVVWYFPLAPRLQRFYADRKEAKLMRWHAERKEAVLNDEDRIEHPVLTHPSDASQWKALDNEFGSFGAEPRNIRLGASTDGFNPFGNQSSTHSTWPVFVWIYNLPPWLCMKRKYIQMSMLIQGPTQPGNDINMYLELLKEELETLWAEEGVDTWDAVAEEYFPLRAALITTVQDYLGYGYISCQVCHGHKACVRCMEETMFLQLGKDPGSSKTVYMGHRRWLQKTDPWRKRGDLFDGTNEPRGPPRKKSGEEIDTLLKGWKECPPPGKIRQKPGEKKKKKATATPLIGVWKRRSVFWDLPYWKILDTPHCLDVMHITKNVCESLLGTLLNMPDRTKDGPKARHDLKVLGIREELQIPAAQEGQSEEEADGGQKRKRIKQPDYYCPPSCFTFSPAEVDQFFNCLLGVRVPFGYSGLISRYMDPKKRNFSGMKSHDCHVMMTQILPVAIRGIMDDHVRATLTGLCNFFDVITRKSISVKKLARLQEEIVVILCELEMYFPPAFFDVMVHLLVHIMDDIVSLGPAFLHNMMPFERMNGVIKGYVRNRSHPDGSIVQGWLTEECISFCTNYLDIEDPVGLPQNKHLRRFEGVGHKNGRKELHVHMSGRTSDFDRANLVALQHIDLIDPWLKEHKTMIENSGKPMMTEAEIYREHNSSFARWFKDHIDANPPPMDSDKDKLVLALSHGPAPNLMTYQAYDINGYTFYTEEKDKNSAYQNSGVTMDSWTGDVKTRYYGRIEEIWELSYAGEKVPMFRIRWAKNVTKEDRYFTTMFLPEANKSKSTNATAQNEPWVLAEHVHQCFFITDPSRPSRVIVRRGKRTIVGMDGVANEEDFEGQVGDPMMEESEDEDTTYTTRRSRTTLPSHISNPHTVDRAPPFCRHLKSPSRAPPFCAPPPPSTIPSTIPHHLPRTPPRKTRGEGVQATMASEEQLEEHYNRHFFRTEEDAEAAGVGGDEDHEMEDDAGGSGDEPSGNEASDAAGDPLNLASLKGWVLLWPKTLIRINTYSGSTASKDKHLAAPQVSVPPRQPAAPVVSAPPQQPAAPVVSAPPQQPAAPVVSAPPQQPAAPEAEEYEREDFQWDIPTSSQVVHEDAPAPKFGCSKKLFDSQETAEEENPEEVAAVAVKKMLSPNTLRATVTAVGDGPVLQPKKRKRANKKDAKDKAAAKDKDKVALLDKLPNNWRPLHHLGEPMLPEHVLNLLTGDMASLHNQVQYLERQLLKSKNPSYPLFVAKVPTGMNFVEKYPADLCFIRFNDIFSIYRMQMLHFSVVRLVALSLSSQIVKEGTPTIAIMDPFYMRESIICNAGDRAIATRQVEDFMLANIKKGAILIPYFPEDMYCTLIVVHPQHSHAVYLDSGRDKKKDYTNIRALLNDALTGFANKAGPLKVERKSRGGLVLTHTTNFPCLRQSKQDNGMDAWYAILQMQEYIKYADDMLLPESLRERSGEFFYGYGLPPNDEIELRLEMSRDERPFNTLEGCRPFPPRRTT
ncbi:hypothetical protein QYE76_071849 [Lolium multiflorum]|uniref:DUF4218 domain-containing protein n=1 Tax=Lolium multiflorum TaxID=4521 RepID=A0AAD8SLN4_LOLMU|nr:hypothetical protein QYE76_071849 [Lolium multiflorum]